MDLFREQLDKQSSGVFDVQLHEEESAKVTTEIFDRTLPSELEFDDSSSPQSQNQNTKEIEGSIINNFQVRSETHQNQESRTKQTSKKRRASDYEILTKSISNFTFKKKDHSLILRQPQHSLGSFIPFQLKIKTFQVKFQDELSELSKGVPTYKLFWKSIVGYVKVDLYIKNGFVYLLEERKEGWFVHSIWDLQNLFKIFSDREESTLRIVFRQNQNNEMKLITKELKTDDLNLLAHIFEEANELQIISDS